MGVAMSKRMTRDEAIERLSEYLNLSTDAVSVAEGYSVLPEPIQRHFKLLLDDYIASLHPLLGEMYASASHQDQLRFNRVIERIQDEKRGIPPQDS